MKHKKLIIFMPSIEGGGVEKNLFIVSNFLSMKLKKVSVISASKKYSKKQPKNVPKRLPNLPKSIPKSLKIQPWTSRGLLGGSKDVQKATKTPKTSIWGPFWDLLGTILKRF